MAQKVERKYMAHYLDTSFRYKPGTTVDQTFLNSCAWYRLGEDLEEYNIELNPNVEIQKNWLGDDIIIHDGYEMTAEASPFYVYEDDALYQRLYYFMRDMREGTTCFTVALEARLWTNDVVGSTYGFSAIVRPCYVVPTGSGGDTSGIQIPFAVYYLNTFVKDGIFVADGSGSGRFIYET